MASRSTFGTGVDSRALGLAIAISALGHVIFFAVLVFSPDLRPHGKSAPSVINVTMVALPAPGLPAQAETADGTKPEPEKPSQAPQPVPAAPVQPPVEKAPDPKTISLATEKAKPKPKPKPKKSLKKKTFKPSGAVKRAIDRIEKQVEKSKTDPLRDTFARLRASVEDEGNRKKKESTPSGQAAGGRIGLPGGSAGAGGSAVELIDIYRVEIMMQIQQNWAFADQVAGGGRDLRASLVFKVMPNGEIRDVFFTDRSGNRYLDESAYRAIMKSNPVKPHPTGLVEPYVEMGLRFAPEGIQ